MSIPLERRRSPRVTAANHPRLPKGIRDVSLGGFSIALPECLPRGSVHDIGLRFGHGIDAAVRVRVAYSRPERQPGGRQLYVTGFAFLADVTNIPSRRTLQLAS